MEASYAASYLPAIFVPIIGWFLPALVMGSLFVYFEREDLEA